LLLKTQVNKLRTFLSFDWPTRWLLLEAFILLGWARVLKMFPFSKIAPILGREMDETSFQMVESNWKTIRKISQAVHIMSRYTYWESMCLVRAIAAMKMLERRQIESTLYLGTGKDESGKLIAHAWLRSGSFYLTGFEVMDKFSVVNKFAKEISKKCIEGENHGRKRS
jgi:hypothetical protein